jgi:hypothetical protein
MYADISQPPKPLPETRLHTIKPGVTLLPPLSRRGVGPGVILLVPDSETELSITDGVPAPSIKWAEEGYTVVTLQAAALRAHSIPDLLKLSVAALQSCLECLPKGKVGLIGEERRSMTDFRSRLTVSQLTTLVCSTSLRQVYLALRKLSVQLFTPILLTKHASPALYLLSATWQGRKALAPRRS